MRSNRLQKRMTAVTTLWSTSLLSSSSISPLLDPNKNTNTNTNSIHGVVTRRHSTLLLLLSIASTPAPASAFDFRISGPKDWLREQKKKSIKYLLAPIYASDEILRNAFQRLQAENSSSNLQQKDLEDIQGMLISAARDCVPQDRSSFVAFQAHTGVEVCTFKLIVTNASSLLDDDDSAKLEAEAKLSDLIRSFSFLNGMAKEADIQLVSDRQKVANAIMDSLLSLHRFEESIKGCIEV